MPNLIYKNNENFYRYLNKIDNYLFLILLTFLFIKCSTNKSKHYFFKYYSYFDYVHLIKYMDPHIDQNINNTFFLNISIATIKINWWLKKLLLATP